MEIEKSLRYRVQVSQTSTGKKSWECTCDGLEYTQEEILTKSALLVKALEALYLPEIKETK